MAMWSTIWQGAKAAWAGTAGVRSAIKSSDVGGRLAPSIHNLKTMKAAALWNIGLGVAVPLLIEPTWSEKIKGAAGGAFISLATAGMGPLRQILAITATTTAPATLRRIGGWHSDYLGQRTMAGIPFSYTPAAMDHAAVSMNYAMQRMNDSYQRTGNEAVFFAARYTQRG